jgi:hypothetical protein
MNLNYIEQNFKTPNPIELLLWRTKVSIDNDIWIFHIDDKELKVRDISNPEEFRLRFHSTFKYPAPAYTAKSWESFLISIPLVDFKLDNTVDLNIVQELIFNRPVSNNSVDALVKEGTKPTALYDDNNYLNIPTFRLKEVLESSGINISYPLLSHALTFMNFKLPGSALVCYDTCSKDSWQFTRTNEVLSWVS